MMAAAEGAENWPLGSLPTTVTWYCSGGVGVPATREEQRRTISCSAQPSLQVR